MTSVDIVYDKIHFRHDSKWTGRLGPPEGEGVMLCVACVIEMMESGDIASVRKSVALCGIIEMLRFSPGALADLLQQDQRVCLHFTASLMGMLHTVEDRTTLEQVVQVMVQLLLELQSEQYVRYVLEEIRTQLSDQHSMRGFLPTVNFLGKLVEAVPNLPQSLVSHHVPLLEHLCSALLYPDEGLKASVLYVWQAVCGAAGGSLVQALPTALRDRVCVLLLQTLANACSDLLIVNCLGLLKQLLRLAEVVSVLMNTTSDQISTDTNHNLQSNDRDDDNINNRILSPNQGQQCLEHCPLPHILKKLLVSGDETLQVASVQCMTWILVHSPSQYCSAFILANIPGFLFERVSSTSEIQLWSVYNCLLLLVEEPLFFSQCHSVYGIESLVRSLKVTLRLTNLEVQKEGLLLLTEILERQPPGVRLFPSGPGFVAVSEAVRGGVSSSSLLVATQAARAATALLRLNHQSSPVQYREIGRLLEVITNRCSELPPLPSSSHHRASGSLKTSDASGQVSRSLGFLLQALLCFQAACRLAEQCASDPSLKENVFRAPCKQDQTEDSLESLCRCLLHCCDVCIPTVTRMCKRVLNVQVLQCFYTILSCQFTLLPSLMPVFATKLASSGFYRLALEHKAVLCAGNRNQSLNASCCGFLHKLSICLLFQPDPASSNQYVFAYKEGDFSLFKCLPPDILYGGTAAPLCQNHVTTAVLALSSWSWVSGPTVPPFTFFTFFELVDVESILQSGLPSLCCRMSDWPSLLTDGPGLLLSDTMSPRVTQYCLVILLHLALQHGDRLLPEQTVFSSVVQLLCCVQEQGDCALPPAVLKSALYLLAITQDKSPDLHSAPLNCISQALSYQNFSSIYTHHPPLLHLIYRYPELAQGLGQQVLELWLTHHTEPDLTMTPSPNQEMGERVSENLTEDKQEQQRDLVTKELLSLIEKYPAAILDLLGIVCSRECPLAKQALGVLEVFLRDRRSCEVSICTLLRPALLQVLQRLCLESSQGASHSAGVVDSLPLVLRLLCVIQSSDPSSSSSSDSEMEGTLFKLLYHVSNLAGRLKHTNTDCLVPALSYLYCSLTLSAEHCSDRAVSMLLSNTGLMDLLQALLSSASASPPSPSPSLSPSSALLCCTHLLLSSLITLQHLHSAQVQRSISWSLDSTVHCLLFQKRSTDSLLLASSLRLLQALLDVDLKSSVVCVSGGPGLAAPRPLGTTDSALYPLGSRGAHCLAAALYGLLLQKQELLLAAAVNCLNSLLSFLHRRSPTTAQLVLSQPWIGFLLFSLLNSGESCQLHPATLTLLTLLLQQGSRVLQWVPHLEQVLEAVERKGPMELGNQTVHALRLLLTQLQVIALEPPPTDEHKQRVKRVMESLALLPSSPESFSHGFPPTSILHLGEMSICLSDFTVKARRCSGGGL